MNKNNSSSKKRIKEFRILCDYLRLKEFDIKKIEYKDRPDFVVELFNGDIIGFEVANLAIEEIEGKTELTVYAQNKFLEYLNALSNKDKSLFEEKYSGCHITLFLEEGVTRNKLKNVFKPLHKFFLIKSETLIRSGKADKDLIKEFDVNLSNIIKKIWVSKIKNHELNIYFQTGGNFKINFQQFILQKIEKVNEYDFAYKVNILLFFRAGLKRLSSFVNFDLDKGKKVNEIVIFDDKEIIIEF